MPSRARGGGERVRRTSVSAPCIAHAPLPDLVAMADLIGKKFVDVEYTKPDGSAGKLSELAGKGKPVIVDFYTR